MNMAGWDLLLLSHGYLGGRAPRPTLRGERDPRRRRGAERGVGDR
jgi:hypothetical protein